MTEAPTIDRPRPLPHERLPQAGTGNAVTSPIDSAPIFAERRVGLIMLPFIAGLLWTLTHCYQGIIGDAGIYIGRVLADFDPHGVGRDMMFVHDGQSRFSLFPLLLDHLVAALGTTRTGLLLAVVSIIGWTTALGHFAKHYVAASFIAVVIIFVALLPVNYGAPLRFGYSEVMAVARPFSEALVLAALAGLAGHRTWVGFGLLIFASLIHPLMALPGWGIFALVLSRENWRWCAAFLGGAALFVGGALAGVPVLDRLTVLMDPTLKAFALSRSPLLFPAAWPIDYLGAVFAEVASLAIAASLVSGRRRLILIGAIGVGIGGIAAEAIFGDYLSLLLVIQAQLWRMAWLMAALGAASLAFCALGLWRQGPKAHVVLAFLSLAWLANDTPESAGLFAGVALIIQFFARRLPLTVNARAATLAWSYAGLVALILNIHYLTGYFAFLQHMPADAPQAMTYFWGRRYVAFPILGALLCLVFTRKTSRLITAVPLLAALFLASLCIRFWDGRTSFQKLIDSAQHPPELTAMLASRPGEILWVDGLTEAWYLAGRPQWASEQQGVSSIFSPELAREYHERMRFLVDEGLAEKNALSAFKVPSNTDLPVLTRENVAHLCARPDAPAWIIAPEGPETIIPPGLATHEWRLRQPNFRMTEGPDAYGWRQIDAYAIIACTAAAPMPN